jgi:hypothetical protein
MSIVLLLNPAHVVRGRRSRDTHKANDGPMPAQREVSHHAWWAHFGGGNGIATLDTSGFATDAPRAMHAPVRRPGFSISEIRARRIVRAAFAASVAEPSGRSVRDLGLA